MAFMEHGNTLNDFISRTTYLGYVLENKHLYLGHVCHLMLIFVESSAIACDCVLIELQLFDRSRENGITPQRTMREMHINLVHLQLHKAVLKLLVGNNFNVATASTSSSNNTFNGSTSSTKQHLSSNTVQRTLIHPTHLYIRWPHTYSHMASSRFLDAPGNLKPCPQIYV